MRDSCNTEPAIPERRSPGNRIDHLDTLRGLAVLGILVMNSVSFGLGDAAYFNTALPSSESLLDRTLAIAAEILVDQKFMALFSILFGAGITLLYQRLESTHDSHKALAISLRRYVLLLLIGVAHSALWAGDVLVIYALAAPIVLRARRWSVRRLISTGVLVLSLSPLGAALVQTRIDPSGIALGSYWFDTRGSMADSVALWLLLDFASRAIGMMLIGVALFQCGFLSGHTPTRLLRTLAVFGTLAGLGLATAGVLWIHASEHAPAVALVGSIPNTLGTLPAVFGYIALFTLWSRSTSPASRHRVQAVGRMALTNYLSQTLLGVFVLNIVLDPSALSRSDIALFIALVWILQLWWSPLWLAHYRQGPIEWLWRSATLWRRLPFRRNTGPDRTELQEDTPT